VEVSVEISVVELDSYGVVCFLLDGPYEADEVEGEILAAAAPGGAAGLEWSMSFWFPPVVGAAFGARTVVVEVFEAALVGFRFGVAHPIIVDDKVVIFVIEAHKLVEGVAA